MPVTSPQLPVRLSWDFFHRMSSELILWCFWWKRKSIAHQFSGRMQKILISHMKIIITVWTLAFVLSHYHCKVDFFHLIWLRKKGKILSCWHQCYKPWWGEQVFVSLDRQNITLVSPYHILYKAIFTSSELPGQLLERFSLFGFWASFWAMAAC